MTASTTTSPAAVEALLTTLDAQCEDYGAMYREGVRQRDCLRGDDLKGLVEATRRMRELMDRVRTRHVDLPADLVRLERGNPEVAARTNSLRQTIKSVLELRDQSEQSARQLLDDTRSQMRQVGTGRRASRGYRRQPALQDPRFVDNLR